MQGWLKRNVTKSASNHGRVLFSIHNAATVSCYYFLCKYNYAPPIANYSHYLQNATWSFKITTDHPLSIIKWNDFQRKYVRCIFGIPLVWNPISLVLVWPDQAFCVFVNAFPLHFHRRKIIKQLPKHVPGVGWFYCVDLFMFSVWT